MRTKNRLADSTSERVKSIVEDAELVAKRRAQLVQAAIALFSRVGYHVATVKDIAIEADVSSGLIYQYVPDKQDLLFLCLVHIVERTMREIPEALTGKDDPIARLHAAIDAYTRVIAANRQAVLLTYRETKSLKPEYIETLKRMELQTNQFISNCIDECIRVRYLEPVNIELLVYRIIMGAHAWALKYWRLSQIVSLDQYLEQSIHSCWMTLLTAKGKRRHDELQAKNLIDDKAVLRATPSPPDEPVRPARTPKSRPLHTSSAPTPKR